MTHFLINKTLTLISATVLLMLVGCLSSDSDEAYLYDASRDLDNGNYDKVIANLGDCSSYPSNVNDCLLDLAAAYYGKGGLTLYSIAIDILLVVDSLTSDEQSDEIISILLNRITDDSLDSAFPIYDRIIGTAICSYSGYQTMNRHQKSACIASNPFLLEYLIKNEVPTDENISVSLKDIKNYVDVVDDIIPDATTEELTTIITQSQPERDQDKNYNANLDSVDATTCAIDSYNSGVFVADDCEDHLNDPHVFAYQDDNNTNVFAESGDSNLANIDVVRTVYTDVNGTGEDSTYYRLVTLALVSGIATTVSSSGYCSAHDITVSCPAVDGVACVPCPLLNDDENIITLDESIETSLNDETTFESAAQLQYSGDDSLTADEKTEKLQREVCDIADNGMPISSTNVGLCTWDTSTDSLFITQETYLNYTS